MHIGDSYVSDVVGAHAAGLSVIFFNSLGHPNPGGYPEVSRMADLPALIPQAWR